MRFDSESNSDSGSDDEGTVHNTSNNTNNDADSSSDDESKNTSHTTKSSSNNDSVNKGASSDHDESRNNNSDDSNSKSESNSDSDSSNNSGSGDSGSGSDSDNDKSDNESEPENNGNTTQETAGSESDASSHDSSSNRNSKKEKPAWEEDPDMYGVRRSVRDRRQPDRIAMDVADASIPQSQANRRRHSSSGSEYSDGSVSPVRRQPKKQTEAMSREELKRIARGKSKQVSYKESASESSEEEDEMSEAEEEKVKVKEEDENVQIIDKIIEHRVGKRGAVGMDTYIYKVEKDGDPNTDFDPNDPAQTERQFLVKWKGWAHIHNTWESEESLTTQKVKGIKKLENYMRKDEEKLLIRNSACPEDVEFSEIQLEIEKNLYMSHLKVDRVFAEARENQNNFFYVKWESLPYADATWELDHFIEERFGDKVESFRVRERSSCTPRQCPALKHRPKFSSIKHQPSYLGGDHNDELELRDYQLQGLNWLVHAWSKHNSCILADEMGLGKTIQAISFISYLFHSHNMYGPYILVLPLSTLNAWEREFSIWAPDINVLTYIGDRDSRKIIRDYEWAFPSRRLKFNVVLTTYEIILRDKDELKECLWSAMLVDEAHRLKNEESQLYQALKEFKSNHRVLITGTPLQNSLKELWALLHFIMPDKFDDWELFESIHDQEKPEKGFHKLHKALEPYLLRRVKKDVEKSLPSKVEQILRVDMTKEQKKYYKWILTRNYDALKKGNRGSTSSFVNIVMELKKCCNHSFLTRLPEEETNNSNERLQQILRGSGKLVLLDKLLMKLHATGHRVLIFSQMVRQLTILGEYLQLRRWPFQRLDGQIKGEMRKQALDHFNAEGSQDFCFLLSTRAGGLGINLATADTVIIFDSDWNPQNDLQAQARAHRIGQKNQVMIYRLVTKNSIEENIIERAKQKMVLDHLVIQSMDTSGRTVFNKKINSNSNPFNKDELNAILKFGAEELFKDEEDEVDEPMCDIDEILRRAETREEGPASAGDELLSAFKVASINIDEDEEVSKLDSLPDNNKDWDDIIPSDVIDQIQEEKKAKEMADLYLPPRSRKTVQQSKAAGEAKIKEEEDNSEDEDYSDKEDGDESENKGKRGRPKGSQSKGKESVKGFNEIEIRRFFKSMKKFSNPTRRLDTIARDAELRDKQITDLQRLAELIIEKCNDFMSSLNSADKDNVKQARGKTAGNNSFKLAGVSINAKTTLAALNELAPLDTVVPHAPVERAKWMLPIKKVKDTHWECIWNVQHDSKLLCGIYEYGMGAWEQIKADPSLNLGDKILLEGDTKPQAKQLESRVQYLLKLIKKHSGAMQPKIKKNMPKNSKNKIKNTIARVAGGVKVPKGITPEIVEGDDSTDDEGKQKREKKEIKTEAKIKEEVEDMIVDADESSQSSFTHKKKKKDKKRKESPVPPTSNGKDADSDATPKLSESEMSEDSPIFHQCRKRMRAVKKHIELLSKGGGENISQEEQISHIKNCLLNIGDHIVEVIANENEDNREVWKVCLWRFVSRFTDYDAKRLHKFYKKTKKEVGDRVEPDKKEEKKEKKKEKKDKSEKKRDREKKGEENTEEPPSKKSCNGSNSVLSGAAINAREHKDSPRGENHRDSPRDHHRGSPRDQKWSDRDKKRDRDNRDRDSTSRGSGDYHRDGYRDRSRDRDNNRDRGYNNRGYNRHNRDNRDNWHNNRYDSGSRYASGGYHRDGYNNSGGYRAPDWRGGPSPNRPPKHSNYGPPPPGAGYPPQGGSGGYYPPPHPQAPAMGAPPPGMYNENPQNYGGGGGNAPHFRGGEWPKEKEGGVWKRGAKGDADPPNA